MKFLCIAALLIAPAFAQDAASEARHHFDNVAASAAGYMHSLDSIEWRLHQEGMTLHPQLASLRARIGAALNEAHRAIDRGEFTSADRVLKTAEELIERLGHKLGG